MENEVVNAFAQVTVIAAILAKVIERVRIRFPSLDGDLVVLFAWILGTGIAWGYGLDISADLVGVTMVEPFNWIVSGLAIGAGSGIIADVIGRSSTKIGGVVINQPSGGGGENTVTVDTQVEVGGTGASGHSHADGPVDNPEAPYRIPNP